MHTLMRVTAVIAALFAVACGSSDNDDIINASTERTGTFVDSPVSGLRYVTASRNGTTNEKGEFTFLPGETVTFSVGGITLPPTPAVSVVTPLELAGTEDVNNNTVTNILRFMQTLDEDGNPDNGIDIPAAAVAAAQGRTLNFSAAVATFEDTFDDVFGTTLIPVDQAVAHFVRQVIPLAGDWRASILALSFNDSSLNPYEDSYWEKVDLDIALSGAFQADSEESGGDANSDNGQFNLALLDETGQLGLNGATEWFGAIDAGKTVFGFVDIDDDIGPTEGCCGGQQWGVAVRRSDIIGYDLSDIAGIWRGFSMTIEDDENTQHVSYAQYVVASNGAYNSTEVTKFRNAPDENDSDSGLFTHAGNGDFAWNPTGGSDDDNGVMDAGKSVIAGVFSGDDGVNGDEEIALLIKQGSDYETSDLRGIWRFFALTAANQGENNYNLRGEMCIENDGSFTSKVSYSDGETGTDSGQLAISAGGELTWPGEDDFIGGMDAGKSVMGFVDLSDKTGDPNGLQIGVMIKTNFLPITFSCP